MYEGLFFIGIIFLSIFSVCKRWQHKYPEDTERTKLTPNERLTEKTWTLTLTTFNGIDYTDSVKDLMGEYKVYFGKGEGHDGYFYGYVINDIEATIGTVWRFASNDQNVSIYTDYTSIIVQ